MRTTDDILHDFLENSSVVKKHKLTEEECQLLIKEYHDSVKKTMLDNGYVQVSDQMRIDVVRLKKRIHVLRGQAYGNHRSYKLKSTIGYNLYKDIEEAFDIIL